MCLWRHNRSPAAALAAALVVVASEDQVEARQHGEQITVAGPTEMGQEHHQLVGLHRGAAPAQRLERVTESVGAEAPRYG